MWWYSAKCIEKDSKEEGSSPDLSGFVDRNLNPTHNIQRLQGSATSQTKRHWQTVSSGPTCHIATCCSHVCLLWLCKHPISRGQEELCGIASCLCPHQSLSVDDTLDRVEWCVLPGSPEAILCLSRFLPGHPQRSVCLCFSSPMFYLRHLTETRQCRKGLCVLWQVLLSSLHAQRELTTRCQVTFCWGLTSK